MPLGITEMTAGCEKECRINYGLFTTTCMGWVQTFDKHGNPTGRDPNTSTGTAHCQTCGKNWLVVERDGTVEVREA